MACFNFTVLFFISNLHLYSPSHDSFFTLTAEKELDRDADAKSTTSESPEPEDVTDARQQLSIILRQRADCYNKRSDLEEQLEAVRKKGSIMEEVLPERGKGGQLEDGEVMLEEVRSIL